MTASWEISDLRFYLFKNAILDRVLIQFETTYETGFFGIFIFALFTQGAPRRGGRGRAVGAGGADCCRRQ